ncbi:sugar ABC transporter ATP-binding protein [Diplocloster hominis]|uniref:sugar ABC transporter ATP-binding protein n=1 Tax=Diplocloster hominis TaxID=3079010 RepID=UPI0031BAE754
MGEPVIFSCKNISKEFSGMRALDQVDMEIHAGEIVGLIGENGAGKSTLLKIIMGFQPATSGEMYRNQKRYAPSGTSEANRQGVGMVYQEQSLIANLTVGQNIFFGFEKNFRRLGAAVSFKEMNRQARLILTEVGTPGIAPEKKVSDLNFATRQMVEIAKVFQSVRLSSAEHYLILLDEPTSLLNEAEIRLLFQQVKKLKAEGHSIIFVSHRLDEVLELTDRIYVFKDGKSVGHTRTRDADEGVLYEMMVGRSTSGEYFKINDQRDPGEKVILEVEHLSMRGAFKDVTFKLHEGEALGICGVVGSGKEELCSAIAGDDKITEGVIRLNGKIQKFHSPADALKKGILTVPKERRVEGIIGIRSVGENISISSLKKLKKGFYLSPKRIRETGNYWIDKLAIKCTGADAVIQSLSGGNAQKVVFARALQSTCGILLLNHPTRGVDVGAKEEIYSLIRKITAQGISVIVLGDTLDECIALSNRVLVMKDGLVTACMDAPKNKKPDQVSIAQYMM